MNSKKYFWLTLRPVAFISVVSLALLGCGGDNNDNDNATDGSIECEEGTFLGCDSDDLILCGINGDTSLRVACGLAGCNEEHERCNDCDPSAAVSCQGNRAVFCNEDGTEAAGGEYCEWGCDSDGTTAWCYSCSPDQAQCRGDDLVTCDSAGEISSSETCANGCNADRGACNDCLPLEVHCIDDQLVGCDPDGLVDEAEDCPNGCDEVSLSCMCAGNECLDPNTMQVCDATGLVSGTELCLFGCSSDSSDAWCNDCVPDTTYCEGDVLHTCDSVGHVADSLDCALGCNAWYSPPRCYTFAPKYDYTEGLYAGVDAFNPSTLVTIDTTAETVQEGSGPALTPSVHGEVLQTGGPDIWVIYFTTVNIGKSVRVIGHRGLAIVASGDITITARIDASAHGSTPGPGGAYSPSGGGTATGDDGNYYSACEFDITGAAGGGHTDHGGSGGSLGSGSNSYLAPDGGLAFGAAWLPGEPIIGGFFGGDNTSSITAGGPGGVILLTSATQILIDPTTFMFLPSNVDVSGGGGQSNGAGGGSGGSILLEAPVVNIDGRLFSVGGGGACGASSNAAGEDGRDGGNGCDTTPRGGDGGYSDDRPTSTSGGVGGFALCGAAQANPGGGGGSIGRLLVRTGPMPNSLILGSNAAFRTERCNGTVCTEFFVPL